MLFENCYNFEGMALANLVVPVLLTFPAAKISSNWHLGDDWKYKDSTVKIRSSELIAFKLRHIMAEARVALDTENDWHSDKDLTIKLPARFKNNFTVPKDSHADITVRVLGAILDENGAIRPRIELVSFNPCRAQRPVKIVAGQCSILKFCI